MDNSTIRHTVAFRLKHETGSEQEISFLKAAADLKDIPGVENFEVLNQVGKKNNFTYGLSMEFANMEAYEGYNNHPQHVDFVQNRWIQEVEDFLEIDYTNKEV